MKKSNDTIEVIAGYAAGDEALKVVADRMGMPYSTLMRKLNINDDYQINATEIIPLVLATGNYSLIEHYCLRLNMMVMPMAAAESINTDMRAVARFAKEAAEAMREMSEAFEDNRVDQREARACRKELMELVQFAWAILRKIEAAADE